eukprot:jgi/Botrbrau1/12191/Bobra.0186s0097.1
MKAHVSCVSPNKIPKSLFFGNFRKASRLAYSWTRCRKPERHKLVLRMAIQDIVGVLVFSALPFLAVQGLADSSLGKALQENVERNKAAYAKESKRRKQEEERARQRSVWYGPDRPKWLGPLRYQGYPSYLKGVMPGDYGFDPAGLAAKQTDFDRYFELELLHARWAMLGALGALLPEVLQVGGAASFLEPRWWNVGYAKLSTGEDLNYLGVSGLRIAGSQGVLIIAVCQVLLMFGPEYARYCGIAALEPLGIYLPGDINYPGGVFDPLELSKDAQVLVDLQEKEIKNGRLAMVAWLGFAFQAAVTRKGPVENVLDFLDDPAHQNVFAQLSM